MQWISIFQHQKESQINLSLCLSRMCSSLLGMKLSLHVDRVEQDIIKVGEEVEIVGILHFSTNIVHSSILELPMSQERYSLMRVGRW